MLSLSKYESKSPLRIIEHYKVWNDINITYTFNHKVWNEIVNVVIEHVCFYAVKSICLYESRYQISKEVIEFNDCYLICLLYLDIWF